MKQQQKNALILMKTDTLSMAEQITGKSYKKSKLTESLGIAMFFKRNELLKETLDELGDTQFSNTVSEYMRIVKSFGFQVVYKEDFVSDRGTPESLYVLFLKELGIIISFDTFTMSEESEQVVNGCNMYYNWSPNNMSARCGLTSSGHFYCPDRKGHLTLFEKDFKTEYKIPDYPADPVYDKDITWKQYRKIADPIEKEQHELFNLAIQSGKRFLWIGSHDSRQGVITIIKSLFENGKFFPIWQDCPFLWLTHYMEHKQSLTYPFDAYYNITRKRIEAMPQEVKDCINNTYRR